MVKEERVFRIVSSMLVLAAASVPVVAAALVAMRVEVQPIRAAAEQTVMAVEIQVAPEDRARIGRNAWVEMELRRGQSVLASSARAVEVDGAGTMRVETSWPAGSFDLRVEIQGQGGAGGFWVGRVTVPDLVTDGATPDEPAAAASATPEGDDEPAPATPATAGAEESEDGSVEQPVERAEADAPPELAPVRAAMAWPEQEPGSVEITAMVLDRNQPVTDLDLGDFRLRVDGDDVALLRAGGVGEAGLWMAMAVDLSASMAERLPQVRDLLGRLSLRADAGLTLLTAAPEVAQALDWGATPSAMAEVLLGAGAAGDGDLAELAASALEVLTDRPGRRMLVLVTDGGDRSGRDDWKRAEEMAGEVGAPILLLAYRTDDLESRVRRSLERMVEVSGGKSYVIQPRDTGLLKLVGDHFGELAEASYAVRFVPPRGDRLHRIRLEAGDGLEVLHPETVR